MLTFFEIEILNNRAQKQTQAAAADFSSVAGGASFFT